MRISRKAAAVEPSATLAISAKAKAMRASGVDVANFSAGEPDFDTPERVSLAGERAIREGRTKYTPTPGVPELRRAIADRMGRDYGVAVTPEQVVVTCGAKHAIYLALFALLDPGDEVIVPAPYWVSYPPQVALCGGVPVIAETRAEDRFRLRPEDLERVCTPKTRALILNSPSNPTGELYTKEELSDLAAAAEKAGLAVISDDIYEKLVYDGLSFTSFYQLSESVRERTIVINGVSKCASMTGWRVGYLVADESFAKIVARLQGQMTSHATSIAQYASIEAVAGEAAELPGWVAEFQRRRDRMVAELNEIPDVSCLTPQGSFYVFPDFRNLIGRSVSGRTIADDLQLADYLLDEARVAVVPGSPFGAPGFLRLSFATSMETIQAGMRRLAEAVSRLT